jgi:hypothetical protein
VRPAEHRPGAILVQLARLQRAVELAHGFACLRSSMNGLEITKWFLYCDVALVLRSHQTNADSIWSWYGLQHVYRLRTPAVHAVIGLLLQRSRPPCAEQEISPP